MFTGLVESIGALRARSEGSVARARIDLGRAGKGWALVLGESIAVDGVCLTVARFGDGGFEADVSQETLARTTLGGLPLGAPLHLERATPAGGRLGGHVVLGHVDGVGAVARVDELGETRRLVVRAPRALAPFLAEKGSVAVAGVSLTVNAVADRPDGCDFELMLVPHTLRETWLGAARPGTRLNLEADVLARYVERQLRLAATARDPRGPNDDERILAKLRDGGFT